MSRRRAETPLRIIVRRFLRHRAAVAALALLALIVFACLLVPLWVPELESLEHHFERRDTDPADW